MSTETVDTSAQDTTASAGGDTAVAPATGAGQATEAASTADDKTRGTAAPAGDSLLSDAPADAESASKDSETPAEGEDKGTEITAEAYGDFKVPEGITVNNELLGEFKTEAAGMKLTKDQAQKLIDLQVRNVQEQVQKWSEVRKGWVEDLKSDKEYGGTNFDKTVQDAKMALRQFDPKGEFTKALQASLYDNNPATIKFLAAVHRAVGEDSVETGRDIGKSDKPPLYERLYKDADMGGK